MSVLVARPRITTSPSALFNRRERLQADYKWLIEQKKILSQNPKTLNKFVAVKDKKVMFVERDIERLVNAIIASGENPNMFAIDFISQHSACYLL